MSASSVKIVEVGPRDGLQNIKELVPTSTKIELIKRLSQTGLRTIEATSFVSPKWVPQLSDAKDVMHAINPMIAPGPISFPVLVPNLTGLEAALQAGVKEIGIFLSATEGFSRKNINCSVGESLVRAQTVIKRALDQDIRVRAYVSCVVDCPYDGRTPTTNVLALAKKLLEMGCYEISLGDTTGAATPLDVRRLLETLTNEIPASKLAGHFHDTFGQAVANVMAAYEMGIRTFDSSVSGLGGCPYSPGAKGNVATEDLVYAFDRMGVETGIELAELVKTGDWISQQLGQPNKIRARAALVSHQKQSKCPDSARQKTCTQGERQLLHDAGKTRMHWREATVRLAMNRPIMAMP